MAATIEADLGTALDRITEAAEYDHPEASRMLVAAAAIEARVASLGPDHDDLATLADDVASLTYCAEDWMWAADNCGSQTVRCRDVLRRYAPDGSKTTAEVLATVAASITQAQRAAA